MKTPRPSDRFSPEILRRDDRRSGLSVLESVGCLMALVGGIWLGAIYLGVDLRHTAYVALSESELIDKVPEQWRPAEPVSETAPSKAELAASMQDELAALRDDVTALGTGDPSPPPATAAGAESAVGTGTNDPMRQASLEYWNRIVDIVHSQVRLQRDAESAATEGNATRLAALKGRIGHYSANAIRALPTAGVDPPAVKLGKELAIWYESGGDLYAQAALIWESPSRGRSDPRIVAEWEQAQLQHRNEGRLLNDRVAAVRDLLAQRFGDGFAPFSGL